MKRLKRLVKPDEKIVGGPDPKEMRSTKYNDEIMKIVMQVKKEEAENKANKNKK